MNKGPKSLVLEVEEIEHRTKPGCNTTTTRDICTCPLPPGDESPD